MSAENKAISRRVVEECINQGNLALGDELLASDYVDHAAPPGLPPGIEGFKAQVTMYRTAFPDIHLTIEDVVGEGEKVVLRWKGSGTHQGELMGIPATNKQVTITGIAINRIVDGKIVEHWENMDQMGMMQQLGVVPPPG